MKKNDKKKLFIAILVASIVLFALFGKNFAVFAPNGRLTTTTSIIESTNSFETYQIGFTNDNGVASSDQFTGTQQILFSFTQNQPSLPEFNVSIQENTPFNAQSVLVNLKLIKDYQTASQSELLNPSANLVASCSFVRGAPLQVGPVCYESQGCQCFYYSYPGILNYCTNGRRGIYETTYTCTVSGSVSCPSGTCILEGLDSGQIIVKALKGDTPNPILPCTDEQTKCSDDLGSLLVCSNGQLIPKEQCIYGCENNACKGGGEYILAYIAIGITLLSVLTISYVLFIKTRRKNGRK
jgi:hypothetical protein